MILLKFAGGLRQQTACLIWNFAEYNHISLGRWAPMVFNASIGSKPSKKV